MLMIYSTNNDIGVVIDTYVRTVTMTCSLRRCACVRVRSV